MMLPHEAFKERFQEGQGVVWVLGGILLLALILRICPWNDLNRGSLEWGEAITMVESSLPLSEIFNGIVPDQGPLKYYILHAMLYFGRGEFLIRAPAIFFDLLSILALFFLGSRLFNKKTALWACFFMAISIWNIHHASSARNYPLYVFSAILSVLFLYNALDSNKIKSWLLYSLSSVIAFYASYPNMFILAAQAGWIFLCYRKRKDLIKRFFLSLGLLAVTAAPLVPILKEAFKRKKDFGTGVWGLQGHEIWEAARDHFGGIAGPYPLAIFVFALGFIGVFYFQKKRSQALLLLMLVIVPVCFYAFCVHAFHMSVIPRYFLHVYPFFLLMAAAGIASFPYRVLRFAGAFVFLVPSILYGLQQAHLIEKKYLPYDYLRHYGDFSGMTSFIQKNFKELDFVVAESDPAVFGIQYYLDKANRSPLVELCKNSDPDACLAMYADSGVTLLGVNGELPLLKDLASGGRLMVIDVGEVKDFKDGPEILDWLKSNAYRIEQGHGADFYFIFPPKTSEDYRKTAARTHDRFLKEWHERRRVVYPFNSREKAFS